MDAITSLLTLLNTLSPLAVIALLGLVIFMLVKARAKNLLDVGDKVDLLSSNHLHELPEIAETLRRIEVKLGEEFSYIKAKLNGR